MSNVASRLFPGVDFLGTALKSRKRKKNSSSLVYVLHKTWNEAYSRRSRAVGDGKEMYKNAWYKCKIVVFFTFFTFSLLSPLSLLKLPYAIVSRGDWLWKPANIKVENNGDVGYVGGSLTMRNPLFFVHKFWLNKLRDLSEISTGEGGWEF